MISKTYNYEDIFSDDPDNSDSILMTVPDDIIEETGWKSGDTLIITIEDNKITLARKDG